MATALLFNFTDTQKLQKIRFALFKLGIAGRIVDAADFHQPVGHLCGLEGFSPVDQADEGRFSDEMLVLTALRRSRAVVPLKAVVTEENASWSAKKLHDEIRREHEAMKGARPRDAEKRSSHRK